MAYELITTYFDGMPVSPDDLNARADILNSQLAGAIDALGIGVVRAGDFLAGATDVAAGSAIIRSDDGTPVVVRANETLPIPARGGNEYLHLVLRVPEFDDSAGTNSVRGAPPVLRVSEDEEEPDAILLAFWDGAKWVDRRPRANGALLELLSGYLGYDAESLGKGTVKERLDKLENTGDIDPDAGVSGAIFVAYKNAQKVLTDGLQGRIDALEAKLLATTTPDRLPAKVELLADEIMHSRNSIAELNVRAIERGNIALVNKNAGHGQYDSPDFSPDTDDPRQAKFDTVTGTFGGDV